MDIDMDIPLPSDPPLGVGGIPISCVPLPDETEQVVSDAESEAGSPAPPEPEPFSPASVVEDLPPDEPASPTSPGPAEFPQFDLEDIPTPAMPSLLPPPPLPSAELLNVDPATDEDTPNEMPCTNDIPMPEDPNRYSPSVPIDDDPPTVGGETPSVPVSAVPNAFPTAPPLPAGPPPPAVPRSIVLGRQQAKRRLLAFSMTKQGGGTGLSFSLTKKSPVVSKDASKVFSSSGAASSVAVDPNDPNSAGITAIKKKPKKAKEEKVRGSIEEIEELKRKELEVREAMLSQSRLQLRMTDPLSTLPNAALPIVLPLSEHDQNLENRDPTGDDSKRQRRKHDDDDHDRRSKRRGDDREKRKKLKTLPTSWSQFNKEKHTVHHFRRFKYEVEKQTLREEGKRRRRRSSRDRRSRSHDHEDRHEKKKEKGAAGGRINLLETPMVVRKILVAVEAMSKGQADVEFPEYLVRYTKAKPPLTYCENPRIATYHLQSRAEMLATVPTDIEQIIYGFLDSIMPKRLKAGIEEHKPNDEDEKDEENDDDNDCHEEDGDYDKARCLNIVTKEMSSEEPHEEEKDVVNSASDPSEASFMESIVDKILPEEAITETPKEIESQDVEMKNESEEKMDEDIDKEETKNNVEQEKMEEVSGNGLQDVKIKCEVNENFELEALPQVLENNLKDEIKEEIVGKRRKKCSKRHRPWFSSLGEFTVRTSCTDVHIDSDCEIDVEEAESYRARRTSVEALSQNNSGLQVSKIKCSKTDGESMQEETLLVKMKGDSYQAFEDSQTQDTVEKNAGNIEGSTNELEPIIRTAIRSKWDSDYEESPEREQLKETKTSFDDRRVEDEIEPDKDRFVEDWENETDKEESRQEAVLPRNEQVDVTVEEPYEEDNEVMPMDIGSVEDNTNQDDDLEEREPSPAAVTHAKADDAPKHIRSSDMGEKLASEYEEFLKMVSFDNVQDEQHVSRDSRKLVNESAELDNQKADDYDDYDRSSKKSASPWEEEEDLVAETDAFKTAQYSDREDDDNNKSNKHSDDQEEEEEDDDEESDDYKDSKRKRKANKESLRKDVQVIDSKAHKKKLKKKELAKLKEKKKKVVSSKAKKKSKSKKRKGGRKRKRNASTSSSDSSSSSESDDTDSSVTSSSSSSSSSDSSSSSANDSDSSDSSDSDSSSSSSSSSSATSSDASSNDNKKDKKKKYRKKKTSKLNKKKKDKKRKSQSKKRSAPEESSSSSKKKKEKAKKKDKKAEKESKQRASKDKKSTKRMKLDKKDTLLDKGELLKENKEDTGVEPKSKKDKKEKSSKKVKKSERSPISLNINPAELGFDKYIGSDVTMKSDDQKVTPKKKRRKKKKKGKSKKYDTDSGASEDEITKRLKNLEEVGLKLFSKGKSEVLKDLIKEKQKLLAKRLKSSRKKKSDSSCNSNSSASESSPKEGKPKEATEDDVFSMKERFMNEAVSENLLKPKKRLHSYDSGDDADDFDDTGKNKVEKKSEKKSKTSFDDWESPESRSYDGRSSSGLKNTSVNSTVMSAGVTEMFNAVNDDLFDIAFKKNRIKKDMIDREPLVKNQYKSNEMSKECESDGGSGATLSHKRNLTGYSSSDEKEETVVKRRSGKRSKTSLDDDSKTDEVHFLSKRLSPNETGDSELLNIKQTSRLHTTQRSPQYFQENSSDNESNTPAVHLQDSEDFVLEKHDIGSNDRRVHVDEVVKSNSEHSFITSDARSEKVVVKRKGFSENSKEADGCGQLYSPSNDVETFVDVHVSPTPNHNHKTNESSIRVFDYQNSMSSPLDIPLPSSSPGKSHESPVPVPPPFSPMKFERKVNIISFKNILGVSALESEASPKMHSDDRSCKPKVLQKLTPERSNSMRFEEDTKEKPVKVFDMFEDGTDDRRVVYDERKEDSRNAFCEMEISNQSYRSTTGGNSKDIDGFKNEYVECTVQPDGIAPMAITSFPSGKVESINNNLFNLDNLLDNISRSNKRYDYNDSIGKNVSAAFANDELNPSNSVRKEPTPEKVGDVKSNRSRSRSRSTEKESRRRHKDRKNRDYSDHHYRSSHKSSRDRDRRDLRRGDHKDRSRDRDSKHRSRSSRHYKSDSRQSRDRDRHARDRSADDEYGSRKSSSSKYEESSRKGRSHEEHVDDKHNQNEYELENLYDENIVIKQEKLDGSDMERESVSQDSSLMRSAVDVSSYSQPFEQMPDNTLTDYPIPVLSSCGTPPVVDAIKPCSPPSPLGFKRSIADSTSDNDSVKPKKLMKPTVAESLSPKRISLDERLERELGVKHDTPPPPPPPPLTVQRQVPAIVQHYSYQSAPVVAPQVDYITTTPVNWDNPEAFIGPITNPPPPVHHPVPQVLQVGNMLQVIPTEPVACVETVPLLTTVVASSVQQPIVTPVNTLENQDVSTTQVKVSPTVMSCAGLAVASALFNKDKHPLALPMPPAMSEAEKAEQKKLEKERRRQEKELRRQAKLKAKTKKMIRKALLFKESLMSSSEVESEEMRLIEEAMDKTMEEDAMADLTESRSASATGGEGDNGSADVIEVPCNIALRKPLPPPPEKGILISPGFREKPLSATGEKLQPKVVLFADGVKPGEGTSPSAGDERPLSPPPATKLPKEKRFNKKKKKKRKVKVRIVRMDEAEEMEAEEDGDDDASPPPPPPGSPPPMYKYPPGYVYPTAPDTTANVPLPPPIQPRPYAVLQAAAIAGIDANTAASITASVGGTPLYCPQPPYQVPALNMAAPPPPPPPASTKRKSHNHSIPRQHKLTSRSKQMKRNVK